MKYLELYSDYLICNAGSYATATGLSAMIEGNVSHDQITRFLSGETQHSKELWLKVKSVVREIEAEDGVMNERLKRAFLLPLLNYIMKNRILS
jgi:hypothetical protein